MGTFGKIAPRSEAPLVAGMARTAIPLLRLSLGITYIWFGALKLIGKSPVDDMVGATIPLLPEKWSVRIIGVWEVLIGTALLLRIALRPTLVLYFVQLAGTFTTFFVQPRKMFQGNNPLLLTKDGEFVIKNLVLISAGLAIGSTMYREHEEVPTTDA